MSRSRIIAVVAAVVVVAAAIAVIALRDGGGPVVDPGPTPTATTTPATPSPVDDLTPTVVQTPTAPVASPTPAASPTPTRTATGPVELSLSDVATDLEAPWGLAFTPDGRTFVTERDSGRLLELVEGQVREVQTFDVDPTGEGGLLGLAVSPTYQRDGLLYAYMTTASDNRVVAFQPGQAGRPIVTGIPSASIHDGGRLAFGPDGMLYIGTGDAGQGGRAQDRASLGGKILRVTPDGGVPSGNPFGDSPVYSLGHRNVQGLAWDADGRLYASEFGPDRDDEINLIQPGGNYGWPSVTGRSEGGEFVDPLVVRQPPDASWSGATVLVDGAIPQWEGDLLVASLRGSRLWRMDLADDGSVADVEATLGNELGRIRLAAQAPDGSLWLLTSNRDGRGDPRAGDDRIARLGP